MHENSLHSTPSKQGERETERERHTQKLYGRWERRAGEQGSMGDGKQEEQQEKEACLAASGHGTKG